MAQVKVGTSGLPDASAMLDIESTEKGFLPPRMSEAERDAIQSPAMGLVVFNTLSNQLEVNNGTTSSPLWQAVASPIMINSMSTNGSAEVSRYGNSTCDIGSSGTIQGTLTKDVQVTNVSIIMSAQVDQVGSYSIVASGNGVKFSASGDFTSTGCQQITLQGTGTPNADGLFQWRTNTFPTAAVDATVAP